MATTLRLLKRSTKQWHGKEKKSWQQTLSGFTASFVRRPKKCIVRFLTATR
jgi:hypothetical protein